MKNLPQKKHEQPRRSAPVHGGSGKQFFTRPEVKASAAQAAPDFRVRLGGVPLEQRAGFELLSLRLKQLLRNTPQTWESIDREEAGSFFALFRKYHLPLLLPCAFFFLVQEAIHFVNIRLFLRHVAVVFPALLALYAGYIFLIGVIAEEVAEHSGGRFVPQSGMRIAVFSTLILSFLSVGAFLPVIGKPLIALGIFWHYRQLFAGARTLLNISDSNYRLFQVGHLLVWVLMGLAGFLVLSVISFLFAKLGLAAI
ncbi:MAG: hypothetical protein ACOY5B_11050 [Spirochaetota bacterium]